MRNNLSPQSDTQGKRTVKMVLCTRTPDGNLVVHPGWKLVFNPNRGITHITSKTLQGSVESDLLEQLPVEGCIQIYFEKNFITLYPNFDISIKKLDEWDARVMEIPKYAFWTLPYGTRWQLLLITDRLVYDITINPKSVARTH